MIAVGVVEVAKEVLEAPPGEIGTMDQAEAGTCTIQTLFTWLLESWPYYFSILEGYL